MSAEQGRRGGALVALVIAVLVALGAAALDLSAPHDGSHLLDRPGAAALAGLAGAAGAVVIAHVLRLLLGRREESGDV